MNFTSSTTFIASNIVKLHHLIRECLESHLFPNLCQSLITQPYSNQWQRFGSHRAATLFSFFTNVFDIPNVISTPIKASVTDYPLWCRYCRQTNTKNLISTVYSSCKHTCKIIIFMFLTTKGRLRLELWPKTSQQADSTKSIIKAT